MKGLSVLVLVASISFIAGAGLTYVAKTPWPSDMADQSSIKPQEMPLLPPERSVPTDLIGSSPAGSGMSAQSGKGHPEMGHSQGTSGASSNQHDHSTAKHDHTTSQHDHGSKAAPSAQQKDSHPLPTDLMGSAGAGPGKTLQSPGGQAKGHDQGMGGHEHGSQGAPQAPAKGAQHNHTSVPHSHSGGAAHGHGASGSSGHQHGKSATHSHGATGVSPGKEKHSHDSGKAEKSKGKGSSAVQQHSHGAGDGHAHGTDMQASAVVNPIKPTEASVKTGHKLFNIYCAVCHGNEGRGGTPMGNKLAGIPKFTAELLRSVDDNHMFSMVTSGHGPMPGYAEALTPEERWHVTNYVRTLQNKLADEKKAPLQGASR